jgi:hypothetical protein
VNDWQPFDEALRTGQRVDFAPRDGKSSYGACPFFNLEDRAVASSRQSDGRANGSLLLSGRRRSLRLQAGIENLHLKLRPGEAMRSPRILQLYWFGDEPLRAYNLFRRTMFHHVMPKLHGKTVAPPIVRLSTSFYEFNDSTESNTLSHLESIKGLGFEMFWLDAYWTRDGFPKAWAITDFQSSAQSRQTASCTAWPSVRLLIAREWGSCSGSNQNACMRKPSSPGASEWVISLGKDSSAV